MNVKRVWCSILHHVSTILSALTTIAVLLLGLINTALLTKSFRAANRAAYRVILSVACVLALVICYFMGRAGIISDEQMVSGSDVAPFYGTEWYLLVAIGVVTLLFQFYLIRKSSHRQK